MLTVFNRAYFDHLGREITGKMPIGNQGDKGSYQVDYEVYFGGTLSYNLSISTTAGSFEMTLNGANWADYGITAGDIVNFSDLKDAEETGGFTGTREVVLVNGNVAVVTTAFAPLSFMYVSGEFYVTKNPEAVKTFLNLIPSDQPSGLGSLIDSTSIASTRNDILTMGILDIRTLTPIGNQSGGGIESITIQRLANRKSDRAKAYRIKYTFYWWYFLTNKEDLFFDVDCVAPYVETYFLPQWNNPSVALMTGFKPLGDGNSGFRNENFNQNPNKFVVDSMKWFDGINQIGGFDYAKPVDFEIKISKTTGTGFGTKAGLIFFNDIQDQDVYSASQSNNNGDYSHLRHTIFAEFSQITVGGSASTFDSYLGVNGEKITFSNVLAAEVAGILTITGTTTPNALFTAKFDDPNNSEKMFVFLARTETISPPATNYSDTVNLMVWRGIGEAYPPILGSYFTQAELFDHSDQLIYAY